MARHVVYEDYHSNVKRNIKGAFVLGIFFVIVGLIGFAIKNPVYGYGGLIFGIILLAGGGMAKLFKKLGM